MMFMISFEFHTQNGNFQLTTYSLQEMSTLFREMSTIQVGMVHGFSHVCIEVVFHFRRSNFFLLELYYTLTIDNI